MFIIFNYTYIGGNNTKKYKYTAINLQKKKFTGVFIAKDEDDLATQLAQQNLFLLSCSQYSGGTPSAFFTLGTGSVSISDLTQFCRQFAIMINAGIPILDCLDGLRTQAFSTFFKNLLQVVYEDVKSGIALSEALNKHEKVFPDFLRSMVYVGEASGKLEMVFNSLADYYEKDAAIRRKTKSAFSYPIMLLCMTVGIVILMLVFIIPTFKSTLNDLNVTPEGFTKIIYDTSDFLVANWLKCLAGVIVTVIAFIGFGKTKKGRSIYDKIAIHMPMLGKVQVSLLCSRFARAFGLLLGSGMDMIDALDAVKVVVTNTDVRRRFDLATEEVKHGMTLAKAFQKYKLFPQMLIQMINVGEKTASLDEVLNRTCDFFDEKTESTVLSVTSKIQPIMLCIMGVVIGTLFLAVYSPIISIMTGIR